MHIEVYGSGSTGNAYGISDGKTKIMLECGVKLKDLNKECGYALDTFDAVLTSHSHGDHSATLYEMFKRGKPCYCTAEPHLDREIFKRVKQTHIVSNSIPNL